MTDLAKATAKAIVNIFETGRVRGRYNAVTVLRGDGGHLSYGRSQASLGSGSLYTLLNDYCNAASARYAQDLLPILPRFRDKDLTLDQDQRVRSLLQMAGDDPVMQSTQDLFFERAYWQPAQRAAAGCSLALPLSAAVVYDGHIHGGFDRIRKRVNGGLPVPPGGDEKAWVAQYVNERKAWLLSCADPLPATSYRMEEFSKLIAANKWSLELPLIIRGVAITDEVLSVGDQPIVAARAPEPSSTFRALQLARPYMRGDDVKVLQSSLSKHGFSGEADGIFGPMTGVLVKQFQRTRGLPDDGVVGPLTWSELDRDVAASAAQH